MKKFTFLLLFMFCFKFCSIAITLNANALSNNGTGGVFTQLTTNASPLTITSFNTQYGSAAGTGVTVEIWSRSGPYTGFTTSNVGWTLLGTLSTTSAGTTTNAPLDVTSLNINLLPSTTTSFYLHAITVGGGIRYFGTGTTSVTTFSDANVTLFTDIARTGAVAFAGTQFTPRAYAGTIDYVISTPPDPCASVTTISCGTSVTASVTGGGVWSPGNCGFATPGKEKVYSFTPTTTGTYTLQTTAASGGFGDYFFKLASGGCSATGWTCIGDANAPESNVFGPLTAGVTYYILFDSEVTVAASQTFQVNCIAGDPCTSITTLTCGVPTTTSTTGTGLWSPGNCGFTTPGQEKIFSYTAAATGMHNFQITAASGGFGDYFFKLASGGCSATGWTCIGDANAPETNSFGPLTAGTTYYILFDPETTGAQSQTFNINCVCAFVPTIGVTETSGVPNNGTICQGSPATLTATGGGTYIWSTGATTAAITVSPAITTIYTVTVTAPNSCIATATSTVTVSSLPVATAVASPNPICSGNPLRLTASGGTAYSWSGPGGFTSTISNPLIPNIQTSQAGIYKVTVTNAAACSSTASVNVVVNMTPNGSASATPVQPCVGTTVQLNATGGGTYSWTGPLGYTSTQQNPTLLITTYQQSGTYTVVVTGQGGCTGVYSAQIKVYYPPIATAGHVLGSACIGSTLQLQGSGAGSYNWSGPGGFTSTLQNPTRSNVTTAHSGIYTLVVTSPNGCTATASTNVNIVANPIVSASVEDNSVCEGSAVFLHSNGASSYKWAGPYGYNSSNQHPIITNIPIYLSGIYTVTGTGPTGCKTNVDVLVNVYGAVNGTATANPNPAFAGQNVQFSATGGSSYLWTGPNGFGSNDQNPLLYNAGPKAAGVYTVIITNEGGCESTLHVTLTFVTPKQGSNEGYFDITSTKPMQGFIFPNPANSTITLESTENSSVLYSVMDANGKVLIKNQVSIDGQIRVESLTPGVYNVIWSEQKEKGATYFGKFVRVD